MTGYMRRIQFPLLALMTIVLVVALGLGALAKPSALWASALYTIAVFLFSCATVALLLTRSRFRGPLTGFSFFGWIYLLMTFGPWPNGNGVRSPPFLTAAIIDIARTSTLSHFSGFELDSEPQSESVVERLHVPLMPTVGLNAPPRIHTNTPVRIDDPVIDWLDQRKIGHSLAALVIASVGAMFGYFLSGRDRAGVGSAPAK
jgi:hypothetical protein